MTREQIRKVHRAQPFKPFTLCAADGKEYTVKHPEFMAISPSGRTIVVSDTDDSFDIIDLLMITSIHVGNNRTRRPRKRSDS